MIATLGWVMVFAVPLSLLAYPVRHAIRALTAEIAEESERDRVVERFSIDASYRGCWWILMILIYAAVACLSFGSDPITDREPGWLLVLALMVGSVGGLRALSEQHFGYSPWSDQTITNLIELAESPQEHG